VRALPIAGLPGYLIFTRYDGATVEVIRVLHGARDILAILDREP
jgi:plasmid stabilization system protein ParE